MFRILLPVKELGERGVGCKEGMATGAAVVREELLMCCSSSHASQVSVIHTTTTLTTRLHLPSQTSARDPSHAPFFGRNHRPPHLLLTHVFYDVIACVHHQSRRRFVTSAALLTVSQEENNRTLVSNI